MPAFKKAGASLELVASASGLTGLHAGKKFGFRATTTDTHNLLNDQRTDGIVISTRHNSHAHFILEALKTGKHVFVEKPLCIDMQELEQIEKEIKQSNKILMVGFNRRFAPHVKKIRQLTKNIDCPKQ